MIQFMPYNDTWKLHRKLIHTYVGARHALSKIEVIEEAESIRFAHRLLEDPNQLTKHTRLYVMFHSSCLKLTQSHLSSQVSLVLLF